MKAIDICCCDGGASEGLNRSGVFESITGVDIKPHPDYPFEFIQKDFQDLDPDWIRKNFDYIWASPPCPQFSWASAKDRNKGKKYPDLIQPMRDLIIETGLPAVIENVVGAPIRQDVILCGVAFGLGVIRHRKFELHKYFAVQPEHQKHKKPYLDAFNQYKSKYMQIAGHGGSSASYKLSDWKKAMDITHITSKDNLTDAIPPAYAQYLAMQFDEFNRNHYTLDMFN